MPHPNINVNEILAELDDLPDGDAGDDRELELLRDLRDIVKADAATPHADALRLRLGPETHGHPVTVDLQEGDNVFLYIAGDRLPPGTSLWLCEGKLTFGYHDEHQSDWVETTSVPVAAATGTCRHCERPIQLIDGRWVDPQATGDDLMWRETCDANDADRAAAHEPTAQEG